MVKSYGSARNWQYALKVLGVSVCLIGAFFMGWGDPILGENHTGIASVIRIVGIGIISTITRTLARKEGK